MESLHGKIAAAAKQRLSGLRQAWRGRSAARRAIVLSGAALIGCLFLVSVAGIASSRYPSLETFGNLQGHFALAAVAVAIGGLALRSRTWVLGAVLLLTANAGAIGYRVAAVETCTVQTAASAQHVLRVMTLNIWNKNHDLPAVEQVIAQHRPDIVVLQEVHPHHAALFTRLRDTYPYQAACESHPDCGVAMLSKFPLRTEPVPGGYRLAAVQTVVKLADDELVILGAHMIRPFKGRGQSNQFRVLTQAVEALPANAVVVGDFNSTLWSSNMARYAKKAGICASNLTHATWPEWLGPLGLPIDHIFLKDGVRLLSIATVASTGSDHRGVVATLGVR
jgi:endonuclease/exonuclease/phosphatase (EEP) superfamily protein YafD